MRQGLQPEEQETIMVGEARHLAQDVPLSTRVRIRRIDNASDPYPDLGRAAEAKSKAFDAAFSVE